MRARPAVVAREAFTMVELVIVVSIIAILAGLAIPRFQAARLSANESSAIASMRALLAAQAITQGHGDIDSNDDGVGENAFFGELTGTAGIRESAGGVPVLGVNRLTPTSLTSTFGTVDANGLVTHSGYHFQIWLPGTPAGGLIPGVAELPTVGGADPANMPNPDACEYLWCCYAWPIAVGSSGNRVFFVSQSGDVLQFLNSTATPYSGTGMMPGFDEAFATSGDLSSNLRVGIPGGNDGTTWIPVQ